MGIYVMGLQVVAINNSISRMRYIVMPIILKALPIEIFSKCCI